jgi:hypothetical protein
MALPCSFYPGYVLYQHSYEGGNVRSMCFRNPGD